MTKGKAIAVFQVKVSASFLTYLSGSSERQRQEGSVNLSFGRARLKLGPTP